jgi:hypothetical protein
LKSKIVNKEMFGKDNVHISVTTFKKSNGKLSYQVHVGRLLKNGSWDNQYLNLFEFDTHIVESLLRKSVLFGCTIH